MRTIIAPIQFLERNEATTTAQTMIKKIINRSFDLINCSPLYTVRFMGVRLRIKR